MIDEHRDMLTNDGISVYAVTRQPNETWKVGDELRPYGNRKAPWANTVIFLEKGGLL